jgi:uncharacterized protein (TIGR02246 family)
VASEQDVRDLLKTYEKSLNTSDAVLAAACYTKDGMFMPTTLSTAAGSEVLDAYVRTFAAIRLQVTFTVDELVVLSDDVAYGLTRSSGTQTVLATGAQSAESNREMFVFRVEDGAWKISRYMFNKPQ